jgi:hypothetical protein
MDTPDYDTALATILTELTRADGKAAALLAALGLPLSVLVVTVPGQHLPVAVTALAASATLALLITALVAALA